MTIEIEGLEDVQNMLEKIAPREARNLMRSTIAGVASEARKDIKARAPVGNTKNLKKAVKAKRRRSPPDNPVSDVIIGKDAFYWFMLEKGFVPGAAKQEFVRPVAHRIRAEFPRIVTQQFGKKLERRLKTLAKKRV